jgi:hypothetical protein
MLIVNQIRRIGKRTQEQPPNKTSSHSDNRREENDPTSYPHGHNLPQDTGQCHPQNTNET